MKKVSFSNQEISTFYRNENKEKQVENDIKISEISHQLEEEPDCSNVQITKQFQSQSLQIQLQKKFIKTVKLLLNVKSFYNQLTKNSRIFLKITEEQYNLISDKSSFYNRNQINKQLKRNCFENISRLKIYLSNKLIQLQRIPIIQPFYIIKTIWDIMSAIQIIVLFFTFSFCVSFDMKINEKSSIFKFVFFMFIIDIIMQFNTGIIKKGQVINDRKQIALNYVKCQFLQDIVAQAGLMQLIYFFNSKNNVLNTLCYLSIYLKCFLLKKTLDKIEQLLRYQSKMENLIDLIKLLCTIGTVCHIFCLLWYGLAKYEIEQLSRYIYSFYYIAVTMITVGYGDIIPQNNIEVTFTVITMFFTGVLYAYSLNCIGNILQNINEEYKDLKSDMKTMNILMSEANVQQQLRVKIINYLEYLHKESNQKQKHNEEEIINKLSKQLQEELNSEIQGKILQDIPLINEFVKKKSLLQIIKTMEECLFSPDEIIYKEQEIDDQSIYYILKGQIKLKLQNKQNTTFKIVEKKQCFGELSFITGNKRQETAIASDFCRIYKIKREDFLLIIKQNSQDYENFQMLKESITIKQNFKFAKIKCFQCSGNHISQNCPKTHLVLSKSITIQKHIFFAPIVNRTNYTRKLVSFKAVSIFLKCYHSLYKIYQNPEFEDLLKNLEKRANLNDTFIELNYGDEQEREESKSSSKSSSSMQYQSNRIIVSEKAIVPLTPSLKNKQMQTQIKTDMVGFHNFIEDGDDKFSLNSDENQQLSESTERLESIYKMNLYSQPLCLKKCNSIDIQKGITDSISIHYCPQSLTNDSILNSSQKQPEDITPSSQIDLFYSLKQPNQVEKKQFNIKNTQYFGRKSITFDSNYFEQLSQNNPVVQNSNVNVQNNNLNVVSTKKQQAINNFVENKFQAAVNLSKTSIHTQSSVASKQQISNQNIQKKRSILKIKRLSSNMNQTSFENLQDQIDKCASKLIFNYISDTFECDRMKRFAFYYPHNNFDKILFNYYCIYKKLKNIVLTYNGHSYKKKHKRTNIMNLIKNNSNYIKSLHKK